MVFINWDHEIETLSTEGPTESFADRIRFRCSHRRSKNRYAHFLHGPIELAREDAVPIVNHIFVGRISRHRLAELLFLRLDTSNK